MNKQSPPDWFKHAEPGTDDADYQGRRKQLLEELPKLLEKQKGRGRAQSFYPYLLVRSVLGDRGDRVPPIPAFWESPDIWTAPGLPGSAPSVPGTHGGTITAGQPNTVYAHVWNLGFAPLAGIRVEFYWANPSLVIDASNVHLIGMARCELSGRGMPGSHALIKCPNPWKPVIENGGHECLIVRVEGIGDPVGVNPWESWLNRHVGQRNVSVVAPATAMGLCAALNATRPKNGRVQLIQLGYKEGATALEIVAPGFRIPDGTETHVLGELAEDDKISLEQPPKLSTGMLASVHPLAFGGPPPPPAMWPANKVQLVDPMRLFQQVGGLAKTGGTSPVAELLKSVTRLQPSAPLHKKSAKGEAHVLRLAAYDEKKQLVGGYTMIVPY